MATKKLQERLAEIQKNLKVPKKQFNAFGKYNFRNCEDILEAVKPHLGELTLRIVDHIENVGDRYYIKSEVILSDGETEISTFAYAREAESKKGMDEAQVTGATSSYARKYALNGMFCIDDTKDADNIAPSNGVELKKITEENQIVIDEYLEALGADRKAFLKYMGVPSISDILQKDYQKAIIALKVKERKAKVAK